MNEKTIILNVEGKEIPVSMRYCLATETGFERMTGKSSSVFSPKVERNGDEIKIIEPPKATFEDYIALAMAGIIAAYSRKKEAEPVSMEQILYDIQPQSAELLIKTINELRNEWYKVPEVVASEEQPEEGTEEKNA